MSQPTTSIYLSASTPAPPAKQQDIVFQSDNGTPQQKISAYDPVFVPDTGAGGLAGNVPAPAAGDAAAGKVLGASGSFQLLPMTVRFVIPNGQAGTNVALMDSAPRPGSVSKCVVVVTASDASAQLTFRIKQNGTDVFSTNPVVAAGAAVGSSFSFSTLTATPLAIAAGDVFSMDILTGTSSWQFIAKLE